MASWVEKAKLQFSITTGDGKVYTPLSMNANRAYEYNLAEFNFRNLDGTLVERRRVMGAVYNLELVFQGGDNLDMAAAFQKSANNRKAWVIKHHFYGSLTVQPISPVFHDNANNLLNITKIMVTVRETISAAALKNTQSDTDVIQSGQVNTSKHFADYYVSALPAPTVKDQAQMREDLSRFQKALSLASDIGGMITNGYNAARSAVNNIFSIANSVADNVSNAIQGVQYMINLPLLIEDSIANKILYLNNELASLADQAADLSLPPLPAFEDQWVKLKSLWMTEAGSIVSAMCAATVTNISSTDYAYSSQVLAVISQLTTAYNGYLANLDRMQTYNGSELDSFIPDPTSIIALDNLVNLTLQTLFTIQANSKQPRWITLTKDNNVIEIARQLYGLVADDSTIDKIIQDNNIGGVELLQVPKGRKILYYV